MQRRAASGRGWLPDRDIPLLELRAMLLHPSVAYPVRDAALGALVARAKAEGGRWSVGIAGVLLPGIHRSAVPHMAVN